MPVPYLEIKKENPFSFELSLNSIIGKGLSVKTAYSIPPALVSSRDDTTLDSNDDKLTLQAISY